MTDGIKSNLVDRFAYLWCTLYGTISMNSQGLTLKSGLKRIEAIFYRTAAGGEPVRDWLKGLQPIEDRKQIGSISRPSSLAGR
jgi:hypothetical protein